MLNEQPVLIWSPTQNKWISTIIYFTYQPATTTNIKDIDGAGDDNTTANISIPSITKNLILGPITGYQELLPLGSIFPTTEIWYTDSSKAQKIIEKDILIKMYLTDKKSIRPLDNNII